MLENCREAMSVTLTSPLPIPEFFDPEQVARIWRVPYEDRAVRARDWAQQHQIAPAESDRTRIGLLLIDVQNTFCLPDFALYVGGKSGKAAIEDNVRLCRFIYRNLSLFTQIFATLDTHTPMQVFHPLFWVDKEGNYPAPGTQIAPEDIEKGTWRVNEAIASNYPDWDYEALQTYGLYYARELATSGRFPLTIWPYHGQLGSIGHALVASVEEAIFFHTVARSARSRYELKGQHLLSENYSALRPEVLQDHRGNPIGGINQELIDRLLSFDALIIGGQAKSHCVAWTVEDLLAQIQQSDPSLVKKIYLLEDCCSPVVLPSVDFTSQADEAFRRFAKAGIHLVQSVEAPATWPDFPPNLAS